MGRAVGEQFGEIFLPLRRRLARKAVDEVGAVVDAAEGKRPEGIARCLRGVAPVYGVELPGVERLDPHADAVEPHGAVGGDAFGGDILGICLDGGLREGAEGYLPAESLHKAAHRIERHHRGGATADVECGDRVGTQFMAAQTPLGEERIEILLHDVAAHRGREEVAVGALVAAEGDVDVKSGHGVRRVSRGGRCRGSRNICRHRCRQAPRRAHRGRAGRRASR